MRTEKLVDQRDVVMPVIAALPFAIILEESELIDEGTYNPTLQLASKITISSSYCREDDSAGYWTNSKSDTKKDD